MDDGVSLVSAWIDAYYTHRDAEMIPLAHPDIEILPRAGQGDHLYCGIEGVERWLEDTRLRRSRIDHYTLEALPDGRVLGEATLEGLDVLALFEFRDDRIARVAMYITDREMLVRLGELDAARGPRTDHVIDLDGARTDP